MATVLITGANRGVGLALARAYAARGDTVLGTARKPEAARELAAIAGKVRILPLDVADEAATARLAQSLGGEAIDVVICNAGVMGPRGGLEAAGQSARMWSDVLMTNVAGAFFSAAALVPHLKRARSGKLALISSQMGSSERASGGSYAYRASKAAVANLGLNLSVDLKASGIAVGIYHPGWVRTDMGGPSAAVTPEASAKGLVERIDKLSLATTGIFEDYLGKRFAF